MYPPPRGRELSPETAKSLDDKFFSSDPFRYFTSRIASLLERLDKASEPDADDAGGEEQKIPNTGAAARFDQLVGQVGPSHRVASPLEMQLQVAVDALALRHQAAETLLRFALARLELIANPGDPTCIWATIVDGPRQVDQVVEGLQGHLASEGTRWDVFTSLVYPAGPGDEQTNETDLSGIQTFAEWFNFALRLFEQRRSLDAPAAHNKVKHGLGVRWAVDDLLFTTSGPDGEGNLPLSAVQQGASILDGPAIEFLSRPPGRPRSGLESTQMRLDPVQLLAEAALMAHEYAAMFCVAADEHFADHADADVPALAAYPGLLVGGPLPEHVRPERPVALRLPLTLPADGGPARSSVIIWADGNVQEISIGEPIRGQIVDDDPLDPEPPL